MFPPRRILAAVDETEMAEVVWERAQDWARRFRAEADALYVRQWVYALGGDGFSSAELALSLESQSLEALRRRLSAPLRCVNGLPGVEIPRWAAEQGYDLLMMGTHGRHGFERVIMGSVAEAVINASAIPVLVVRSSVSNIRSVVCPVNGKTYSNEALLLAGQAAVALKRRLRILHVIESPLLGHRRTSAQGRALVTRAMGVLPPEVRARCRPEVELVEGEAAAEIAGRAGERDLVVLAAHSRGFLRDRILGTTAQKVLRYSVAAVLAVPMAASAPERPFLQIPAWLRVRRRPAGLRP